MTQDEIWDTRLAEVWAFVKKNNRFPSRHHIEEHKLLNWMKYNRKMVSQKKLNDARAAKFKELNDYVHQFHTVNQYK